jgi:glycosyltransferase involved in cell wall biosynthesis
MSNRLLSIAVFHNLPSGGAKRGLYGFVRELAIRGHRLSEIRLSTAAANYLPLNEFMQNERVIAFRPYHLPIRVPLLSSYLNAVTGIFTLQHLNRVSKQVSRELDNAEYDLVFAHDCGIALQPPILQHLRTPTVFYCHHAARGKDYAFGFWDKDSTSPLPRWQAVRNSFHLGAKQLYWNYFTSLERRSARSATQVLTNSAFSCESYFRDFGVSAQLVPYGVDLESFYPVTCQKANWVLSVGEVSYRKGYRFLIRALGKVSKDVRPVLVILSNESNPEEVRVISALAQQLGVQIKILRIMDHRELVELYSQAQMLVYTPIMEAFGLASLEAMACGTPVIAVREGGPRESIVDGETGLLVDRDEGAFADAVSRLLANPGLRDKMGRAGREYVRRSWTWQASGDRLDKQLQMVVRKRTEIDEQCQKE